MQENFEILLQISDLYGDLGPAEAQKGEISDKNVLLSVHNILGGVCSHNVDFRSENFLGLRARDKMKENCKRISDSLAFC